MNKARRKKIAEAAGLLEQARSILNKAQDEEQEAYDNLPESLQRANAGEEMGVYIDILAEAIGYAEDAYDAISDIA